MIFSNKIKKNDAVKVFFSDGHAQIGFVKHIFKNKEYKYVVKIKLNGKTMKVHCREKDIVPVKEIFKND